MPPRGYADLSYSAFLNLPGRSNRGTVYLGANDGMLHAFRLGKLTLKPDAGGSWPASQKATLTGSELGKEEWAFVPGNALPYLRYLREPGYSHLFFVDGGVTLVDASLGDPAVCGRSSYWNCPKDQTAGKNWRSVLIGGMGLGGASRGAADACGTGASGVCVKAPAAGGGLSSYFALDVTGQTADGSGSAPTFLWEFAPPGLGFATSGAAVLKINARGAPSGDRDANGRWFAVFASGPTGPIDCASCQFLGRSDQNLRIFVVDLNAVPPLTQGVNYWVIDTGIAQAFGGSMAGAGIDTDRWNPASQGYYQDDALYLGYTRKGSDGNWNQGGVLRLLTREDPDPSRWSVSTLIDGVGPVTGGIAKLQDRKNHRLWLYFGTGRYFFNQDDMSAGRSLFGVTEPCYTRDDALVDDGVCSAAPLRLSDLSDATSTAPPFDPALKGWRIGLDPAGAGAGSERMAGTPSASSGGTVFFTSFQPSTGACEQGSSYLWGVRYDTGGTGMANGKALVPLANGSAAEIPLSGWSDRGGRRGPRLAGKPTGLKVVSNSGLKPLKKIIHIQER